MLVWLKYGGNKLKKTKLFIEKREGSRQPYKNYLVEGVNSSNLPFSFLTSNSKLNLITFK